MNLVLVCCSTWSVKEWSKWYGIAIENWNWLYREKEKIKGKMFMLLFFHCFILFGSDLRYLTLLNLRTLFPWLCVWDIDSLGVREHLWWVCWTVNSYSYTTLSDTSVIYRYSWCLDSNKVFFLVKITSSGTNLGAIWGFIKTAELRFLTFFLL